MRKVVRTRKLESEASEIKVLVEGKYGKVYQGRKLLETVQFEQGDDLVKSVNQLKRQYEGKSVKMENKVGAIRVATKNDAMGYDGIRSGMSRTFEVNLDEDDAMTRVIMPLLGAKKAQKVPEASSYNMIVMEVFNEDDDADMTVYMDVMTDDYESVMYAYFDPNKASLEDVHKYLATGSGSSKIIRASFDSNDY